ncbi:hypothetical protein, partial [Mesorhizobium sp. M7A.F.Ca.CA.002.10.1.1]
FSRPLRVTVRGKLCRNPFSTIKLPHEHGGSKAVWGRSIGVGSLREHAICHNHNLDLLLHARALCIQKA